MKKTGFTLAEVLITLAVIGIVAAMTIPNLVQNYKKREYSTRLKKFYSTMEQLIRLSEIDNGNIENWSKGTCATCYLGDGDYNEAVKNDREQIMIFYKKYIKPYLKVNQEDYEYIASYSNKTILVYLPDGSTFTMHNGDCSDVRYDVNGMKNPNVAGRDIYGFVICPSDFISNYGFNDNQKLKPLIGRKYTVDSTGNLSREKLLERCKTTPGDCAGLLMYDGWEFKDDYPYKL